MPHGYDSHLASFRHYTRCILFYTSILLPTECSDNTPPSPASMSLSNPTWSIRHFFQDTVHLFVLNLTGELQNTNLIWWGGGGAFLLDLLFFRQWNEEERRQRALAPRRCVDIAGSIMQQVMARPYTPTAGGDPPKGAGEALWSIQPHSTYVRKMPPPASLRNNPSSGICTQASF